MSRPEAEWAPDRATTPRVEYRTLAPDESLPKTALAAVTFGNAPRHADPRCVRVGLEPLRGAGVAEVWHATGPVSTGFDGPVQYAADGEFLFAVAELDERGFGGIEAASQAAYAAVRRFQSTGAYPHVLRMWNYFGAINEGVGDEERYKLFCLGRERALGIAAETSHPAATAIGFQTDGTTVQVIWLAGRRAGLPLENPRQVSAYRYPRQYGPVAPRFSRAMLVSGERVLVSGTASIIGHVSRHPGNLRAQLDETLANLESVLQRAAAASAAVSPRLGHRSLLKVYLREAGAADEVDALLRARLPKDVPFIMLAGDICRADLLVEIECIHGAA